MTLSLRARNRRVLAKRLHWPPGALQACEDLEREHDGIIVSWRGASDRPGFEEPAGFYAWPAGAQPLRGGVRRREWYGATVAELAAQLP